jgi:glycosyltransferase involved in cell wall biosynthesis
MGKKRIAIIGTAGVPNRYGGFETLAHNLILNLSDEFDFTVYCTKKLYKKEERVPQWHGAKCVYWSLNANGAQSILYDIISMIHAIFFTDVLLVFGVSGGIIIPFLKLFSSKKIIVHIDGLEWRRQKWKGWIKRFLRFSEYVGLKYADADIADNFALKRYTAIYYGTLSYLLEYGGNHTIKVEQTPESLKKYPFTSKSYAFKVCRIEPENNIHVILEAFATAQSLPLVLVGNWQNSSYGINLYEKFKNIPNIHLLAPIYDQKELDILRSNCALYLHGHSAGGTNPSLVEAMYLGLPVLAFDIPYNRATTENQALFFKNLGELVLVLKNNPLAVAQPIGKTMQAIALKRYTWEIIAKKYRAAILAFDYGYTRKKVKAELNTKRKNELNKNGYSHLGHTEPFYKDPEKNYGDVLNPQSKD